MGTYMNIKNEMLFIRGFRQNLDFVERRLPQHSLKTIHLWVWNKTNTEMKTQRELQKLGLDIYTMSRFTGTTAYYKISRRDLLTDGTKHLAEKGACFWMTGFKEVSWQHEIRRAKPAGSNSLSSTHCRLLAQHCSSHYRVRAWRIRLSVDYFCAEFFANDFNAQNLRSRESCVFIYFREDLALIECTASACF